MKEEEPTVESGPKRRFETERILSKPRIQLQSQSEWPGVFSGLQT